MKLSVLAFVGAAAAIPQYNVGHGHGKYHSSKAYTPAAGHAYPTGGWGNYNSSAPAIPQVPQGTGSPSKPAGEETSYTDSTITSTTTRTIYLTQYPSTGSSAEPTVAAVKDVSSSAPAVCGQTVYVTEKNVVTVTVPAGGYSASAPASSAAPEAPSSAPVEASSSAPAEAPSSKPAENHPSPAPVASVSSEAGYQAASSFVLASSSPVSKEQAKPTPSPAASSPAASQEAYSSAAPASSVVASSSAASKPSSTPATGYAGGKRGLAYRWDGAADCKSFEGKGNFGFAWNWEADTKGDIGSFAANFIPTLRTLDNAADWSSKAQAAIDAGSKVLFGLNEPDIASQANLGVSALCDAWKEHMNPFHGKATIVGPSVSSSENAGQGLDYLTSFASQCPEAQFDDINIHWYGPASAGFDAFKAHYEKAAAAFSGKKVWVTEFGLTGATPQESADFLKSAQSYLDGESSCAGYSYFAVGNWDPAANLLGTASALSEAGKVYVS